VPRFATDIYKFVVEDYGSTNIRRVQRALAYWRELGVIAQDSDWLYLKRSDAEKFVAKILRDDG